MRTLLQWLGLADQSEAERQLRTDVQRLELELAMAKLENELLGHVNENLRAQILSNTAVAFQIARVNGMVMEGAKEPSQPTE